jgi:Ala-tRNA(Pro) deacylase
MAIVEDYLNSKEINFQLFEHPPVFTCEEAEKHCSHIPGLSCKNLLLCDKKAKNYYLVILPASKRSDLKKFAEIVGQTKVTFASPKALFEKLGLEPGSVSPFGLLNDINNEVQVYIDKEVYNTELVSFHPNRNTASIVLSKEMFHKYLNCLQNKISAIEL